VSGEWLSEETIPFYGRPPTKGGKIYKWKGKKNNFKKEEKCGWSEEETPRGGEGLMVRLARGRIPDFIKKMEGGERKGASRGGVGEGFQREGEDVG